MRPEKNLTELFGIELPIIQAPMASSCGAEMTIAVCEAGGLGSLPCAMLTPDVMRQEIARVRQATNRPMNVNFFCHQPPAPDADRDAGWGSHLAGYYSEHDLDPAESVAAPQRNPFDDEMCGIVEHFRPEVVSFHFGLPEASLLKRVKAAGCLVISSATTVQEARWLAEQGCDAIIAQDYEAGGHRGMFLHTDITTQVGTMALVPQVVDAVDVPVIAAGGIADGRGVAAAMALGASAVQVGTAYLFTRQALVPELHRRALENASENSTALTNLFSGRPARGLMNRLMHESGPMNDASPAFPTAGARLAPLKKAAEAKGSDDFTSLWSGQAAGLGGDDDAGDLTRRLVKDALERLKQIAP